MRILQALAVVTWLASPLIPSAVATESLVRNAPASIDASGRRDVTAELQAFLDAVPNHGVARLAKGGVYRVDGTLLLSGRHDLRLDGNGARIFAATPGDLFRSHLHIVGGSNLVIDDLEIQGANPYAGLDDRAYQVPKVGQYGIKLDGVTNVELVRVNVHDVYGDLVYIGNSPDARWTQGVWIHDSIFQRSGRQGLTVAAGRDVVIEHNAITDARRASIDLEPNGRLFGAENVQILDNRVGPGRLLFVAAAGVGRVNDVVVARNELLGHILNMMVIPTGTSRRSNFYVVDNHSSTPASRAPLNFTRVDGVVVEGNVQPVVRPGEPLVTTRGVCGIVVADNLPAPGTLQLVPAPAPCGRAPSSTLPPVPAAAGRPHSGAPPPTTTSTTTTLPQPAKNAGAGQTSSDDDVIWYVVAAVMLAGLVAAIGLLRSEARRRPGRDATADRSRTSTDKPSRRS